jgi:hypothetical protein
MMRTLDPTRYCVRWKNKNDNFLEIYNSHEAAQDFITSWLRSCGKADGTVYLDHQQHVGGKWLTLRTIEYEAEIPSGAR